MNFLRQHDFLSPEKFNDVRFHVIGAGAVGSYTALILGKMGAQEITIYDPDRVEETNISNQLYKHDDIGKNKVDVLESLLKEHTETEIRKVPQKFNNLVSHGIVISAVDSMESRKDIWDNIKDQRFKLYIDSRMGGLTGVVYPVYPGDSSFDQKLEGTRVDLPCTGRGISYTSSGISSFIGILVKKFLNGQETPVVVLDFELLSIYTYPSVSESPDF